MKSVAAGLSMLLLVGVFAGCGGDEGPTIFLRPLEPGNVTIPVGTTMKLTVTLSAIPATDMFVDIANEYKQFITTNPADSLRFQPKDDPPEKIVEVTAIKANTSTLPVVFTLRGTTSKRTARIRPEGI